MDSLNDLLLRCGRQDGAAFKQLYQQSSPRLYALCCRLVRDEALAEDVLQEGFIKIWHSAASYSIDKGHALTWMATVVRNQALDRLRMAKSRPEIHADVDYESLEFASQAITPDLLTQLSSDTQQLLECMEHLKPEQRECILQAFYYGCTHEELAESMERPLGTVKAWIRRGLEQLRNCLA